MSRVLGRRLTLSTVLVVLALLTGCGDDELPPEEADDGLMDAMPDASAAPDAGVGLDGGLDGGPPSTDRDAGRRPPATPSSPDAEPDAGPPLVGPEVEIDGSGGFVAGAAGISLAIPPEAIADPTTFQISEIRGVSFPEGYLPAAPIFELGPDGQMFDRPARAYVPISLGADTGPPDAAVVLFMSFDGGETWERPYLTIEDDSYRLSLDQQGLIALAYRPSSPCTYDFDATLERGQVHHQLLYMAAGLIQRESYEEDVDGDGEPERTQSVGFRYDADDRVTQRSAIGDDATTGTKIIRSTRIAYADNGLTELWSEEVSRASTAGASSELLERAFTYEDQRLVEELETFDSDNDGSPDRITTTSYLYDDALRLVEVRRIYDDNADGAAEREEVRTETYDELGDHVGTLETVDMDADGTPESELDTLRQFEEGQLVFTRIEVRDAGQVTKRTLIRQIYLQGIRTETITEEDDGADLVNDLVTTQTYNTFGDLLYVQREVPPSGPRMPSRETTTYTFDPMRGILLRRVDELDIGSDNLIERTETWSFTSDAQGRPTMEASTVEEDGDGLPDTRTARALMYDDDHRLLSDTTLEDLTGDGVFDNLYEQTREFDADGLEIVRTDVFDEGNDGFAERDFRADMTYTGDCKWLSSDVVTRSWDAAP